MKAEPFGSESGADDTAGLVLDRKLGPPPFAVRMIERPRLIEALGRRHQRLVVLEAPPGFGKTALLSQWLAQNRAEEAVWVTIEVGDDAASIVDHLRAGFARNGLPPPDPDRSEADRPAARLQALLAAVERSSRCWAVVLDNVDRASGPACADVIEPLARLAPDGLRLILACSGREFELRSEVFTPLEMLRQATSMGAEILMQEDRLGCVKADALADLIVVDGDPLKDIGLLAASGAKLDLIVRDGEIVKNRLN